LFRVWDFGDNTTDTSYLSSICHTYDSGGLYRVTLCIYDSLGCPDCDSSKLIQVINNPIADAGADRIVCSGAIVNLTGSGGVSCQWLPAGLVSDPNICNPTTVIFTDSTLILIVTDQYQCVDSDTLILSVAQVLAGFDAGNTFCLNDSICLTDTSSSVNGTLQTWTYDFGEGPAVPGPNACHKYLASGTFTISEIVTDDNLCSDTALQTITINPNPVASFAVNSPVICSNQPLCVVDASTGVSLTWNWSYGFAPGGSASGSTPPCILYPSPYQASYNVSLVVTDINNCSDSVDHIVSVNEAPTANFNWSPSCDIEPMPLASTSIAGDAAIGPCQWTLWLGAPTPFIDNNCNASFLFPAGLHDVQLIISDLNGCADTIVKTVLTDSIPQVQINGGDTTICIGVSVDYNVSGIFNNINWSPNIWISDPNSAFVTITPLGNVSYIVSSVNGACRPATDTVTLYVIQHVPIELDANPASIVLGLNSQITSQIPGQIDSIVWSPDSTLDCRDCFNPVATPSQTTTYYATIYYSQNGVTCSNMDSVTITFLNSCDDLPPYLPNTFTPNQDGMNDVFMIRGVAGKKINYFRIFDRWGKLVFESTKGEFNDPRWGWNGNDRNGSKLNPAVFVYTYEIECLNGDMVTGKGNVSLVR
jgi:gliding motility-associated-like protein